MKVKICGIKTVEEIGYCNELLPDFIAQALELGSLEQITFSKYYMGRSILNER